MSQLGQTEKNLVRAYVFRFALELGHCSTQSTCLKSAISCRNSVGLGNQRGPPLTYLGAPFRVELQVCYSLLPGTTFNHGPSHGIRRPMPSRSRRDWAARTSQATIRRRGDASRF